MTSATWNSAALNGLYENSFNWDFNSIPGDSDTAFFGTSATTSISIVNFNERVGGWTFIPGASVYNFSIGSILSFFGGGITVNSGIVNVDIRGGVDFFNTSTAGEANITIENGGGLAYNDGSTAGGANILNDSGILIAIVFNGDSTAGNANITNNGKIIFRNNSTAGNAAINNSAGGKVALAYIGKRPPVRRVTRHCCGQGTAEAVRLAKIRSPLASRWRGTSSPPGCDD
jgi:hypothetical protein